MGGEHTNKEQSIGEITLGIKPRTFQLTIINFVYQQLPFWRDNTNRPVEQSEDKLNLQLCKFLDSCAREDFPMVRFDHEEYQTDQRQVDLSASPVESMRLGAKLYTIYDPILVLESKRLPAPPSNREKEYVTGSTPQKISGGIQRFKLGLHGKEHDFVAMIGYVQDRSACHWHGKINGWILELVNNPIGDGCIWTANETLNPLEEDKTKGIASYRSNHSRTIGDKIEIHHLWITMNVEKR